MVQMGLEPGVLSRPLKVERWVQNAHFARTQAHFYLRQRRNRRSVWDQKSCTEAFRYWMKSARHALRVAKANR